LVTSDGLPLRRTRVIIATNEKGEKVEVEEEYEAWDKVVSPRQTEEEIFDYHALFEIVMQELEKANMIYSRRPGTMAIEAKTITKIEATPTPLLEEGDDDL